MQTVNVYREQVAAGADPQATFVAVQATSRDRGRSPYQWNETANAGFTTGSPWIGVNPNYREINLEANVGDPASVFHHYRRLIALRKRTPALLYGEFIEQAAPAALYVYRRTNKESSYEIVLNLSAELIDYRCTGTLLIGNYTVADADRLRPYEARVYQLV